MTGVALLLTGPLQSWGGSAPSIYERPTEAIPSLSGVVGIIANALGRRRTDPIEDIARDAELAVRVDRSGTLLTDFHTVGAKGRYALASDTGRQLRNSVVTNRQYLSDATFLTVYTPPPGGISPEEVLAALLNPKRPIYLGRLSCPPSERIGICTTGNLSPEDVFYRAALLRDKDDRGAVKPISDTHFFNHADGSNPEEPQNTISVLMEMTAPAGTDPLKVSMRQDVPQTFNPRRLYHLDRPVITKSLQIPAASCVGRGHDGVAALYKSLGVQP